MRNRILNEKTRIRASLAGFSQIERLISRQSCQIQTDRFCLLNIFRDCIYSETASENSTECTIAHSVSPPVSYNIFH